MDFRFTDDQLAIQDAARRIARERIAPVAAEFDRLGEFPVETMKVLGENGMMGIEVPHEYGGAGMDAIAYVLAMIEIAAADCAPPSYRRAAGSAASRAARPVRGTPPTGPARPPMR